MAAEVFNYEEVKSKMESLISKRNDIRGEINLITDELDKAVTNSEIQTDRALCGEIAPIKNRWNTFLEAFNTFSQEIENIATKVSGTSGSASATNKAFETSYGQTFSGETEEK